MVDLGLLQSFLAVYRSGSITRAAGSLNLSQPAVSAHIRSLESQLGRPLFHRLPRGIAPTEAAHDLARSIGGHLDALQSISVAATTGAGNVAGTCYLGGPGEFLAARVLPALAALPADGVRLVVRLGTAAELVHAVAAAELDLAVATQRVPQPGIDFQPLCEEEFVLVAGTSWAQRIPRRRLERDGPAALADVPLLAYAADLPILRRYWRVVFNTRLRREPTLVVADLRALLAATVAGMGVTVLPRYLCHRPLLHGELVQLLAPAHCPRNTLLLASRPGALTQARTAVVHATLCRAALAW